jgi:hypothetical protein
MTSKMGNIGHVVVRLPSHEVNAILLLPLELTFGHLLTIAFLL